MAYLPLFSFHNITSQQSAPKFTRFFFFFFLSFCSRLFTLTPRVVIEQQRSFVDLIEWLAIHSLNRSHFFRHQEKRERNFTLNMIYKALKYALVAGSWWFGLFCHLLCLFAYVAIVVFEDVSSVCNVTSKLISLMFWEGLNLLLLNPLLLCKEISIAFSVAFSNRYSFFLSFLPSSSAMFSKPSFLFISQLHALQVHHTSLELKMNH